MAVNIFGNNKSDYGTSRFTESLRRNPPEANIFGAVVKGFLDAINNGVKVYGEVKKDQLLAEEIETQRIKNEQLREEQAIFKSNQEATKKAFEHLKNNKELYMDNMKEEEISSTQKTDILDKSKEENQSIDYSKEPRTQEELLFGKFFPTAENETLQTSTGPATTTQQRLEQNLQGQEYTAKKIRKTGGELNTMKFLSAFYDSYMGNGGTLDVSKDNFMLLLGKRQLQSEQENLEMQQLLQKLTYQLKGTETKTQSAEKIAEGKTESQEKIATGKLSQDFDKFMSSTMAKFGMKPKTDAEGSYIRNKDNQLTFEKTETDAKAIAKIKATASEKVANAKKTADPKKELSSFSKGLSSELSKLDTEVSKTYSLIERLSKAPKTDNTLINILRSQKGLEPISEEEGTISKERALLIGELTQRMDDLERQKAEKGILKEEIDNQLLSGIFTPKNKPSKTVPKNKWKKGEKQALSESLNDYFDQGTEEDY